jgi:hypothetical protein
MAGLSVFTTWPGFQFLLPLGWDSDFSCVSNDGFAHTFHIGWTWLGAQALRGPLGFLTWHCTHFLSRHLSPGCPQASPLLGVVRRSGSRGPRFSRLALRSFPGPPFLFFMLSLPSPASRAAPWGRALAAAPFCRAASAAPAWPRPLAAPLGSWLLSCLLRPRRWPRLGAAPSWPRALATG